MTQYDAATALRVTRENSHRAWVHGPTGVTAKDRLAAGGFLDIAHRPKFMLDPKWPIFTMGSCFAREIENFMIQRGLPILTKGHGVERHHFQSWESDKPNQELYRGALNKYTIHSMSHEIRTALCGEVYPDEGLIQLNAALWTDPHSAGLKNSDYETVRNYRRRIAASTSELKNAKVVFLTLGLTETWIYTPTGMPMNSHPGGEWLIRLKDRLAFVDYGFQDALNEMVNTIGLIRKECDPEMKFIITVRLFHSDLLSRAKTQLLQTLGPSRSYAR